MSAWTKGPWMMAAKPSSIVGWPVVAPRQGGRMICDVTYVAHSKIDPKVPGDDAFNRESRANGQLISAAPELAAALQDLMDAIGNHDPEWAWQERINARDALIKAGASS